MASRRSGSLTVAARLVSAGASLAPSAGRRSTSTSRCSARMAVEAGPGEPGEIASRGDNVMLEYYNEPEQTAAVFRLGDGWLLHRRRRRSSTSDGFITLIDRAKDMLISGGENIYPKEIENVIYDSRRLPNVPCSACPTRSGARCRLPTCN